MKWCMWHDRRRHPVGRQGEVGGRASVAAVGPREGLGHPRRQAKGEGDCSQRRGDGLALLALWRQPEGDVLHLSYDEDRDDVRIC